MRTTWTAQTRSAVAGIAEDVVLIHYLSTAGDVGVQSLQLLLNGLCLGLSARWDPGAEGNAQPLPPLPRAVSALLGRSAVGILGRLER